MVDPLAVAGLLLGFEAVVGIVGLFVDSSLDRGKGNSRAGGMGTIFVPPSSAEEEPSIVMKWCESNHRVVEIVRSLIRFARPTSGRTFAPRKITDK